MEEITLLDFLGLLWWRGEALVFGLLIVIHEAVAWSYPPYKKCIEGVVPIHWRLSVVLAIALIWSIGVGYGLWREKAVALTKVSDELVAKATACKPKVEWQELGFQFDEGDSFPAVIGTWLVIRQSRLDYGIFFETSGGDGKGIWAETLTKRPQEIMKKDKARIQQPDGMAHYLYMPEGVVRVLVRATRPVDVDFDYKVECFQ